MSGKQFIVALVAFFVAVPALAHRLAAVDPTISAEQLEFFESKIRPILVENCYECHSTDADDIEGGLLLDSRAGWTKGGDSGPAIIPGNVNESLIIHALRYEEDVVSAMPPKSKLPDATIKLLEKWVEMGAPDPRDEPAVGTSMVEAFDLKKRFDQHWSWRPIQNPPTPDVTEQSWSRNRIDQYILARLEAAELKPAAPADKETWIRRVYFDVIGLPPTAAQIDAFLADDSDTAQASVVDGLLDSPHFGEKWARHWMDLVRYAETYGHEFDYAIPHPTEYRDYLIRAFNADVPYDQFIREHIAGDLITRPRRHPTEFYNESIIGTGFWYFHEATHAPTDVLKNEADIIDNQIDVFGKTFLGLTIACARCHDHKFDAISTADYYALSAYIHSSCRQLFPLDPGRNISKAIGAISTAGCTFNAAFYGSQALHDPKLHPAPYFEVASGLIRHELDHPTVTDRAEVVFESFDESFDNWTLSGDFPTEPQRKPIPPQTEIKNQVGVSFASSFTGSDKDLGTLTSKPFKINHPFIKLLVGGGNKKVFVELVVDDKSVLKAVGENREELIERVWDVRGFIGKNAMIRIVDEFKGGWGHINVDHIVFSNTGLGNQNALPTPSKERIEAAAKDNELDLQRLEKWISLICSSEPKVETSKLAEMLAMHVIDKQAAKKLQRHVQVQKEKREKYRESNRLFADFSGDELPDGWTTSGYAFEHVGDLFPDCCRVDGYAPQENTMDSGFYGKRATGILRSPTFKISTPSIHVRMRATANIKMKVVIDNYQMTDFHKLLFNGVHIAGKETDTSDDWQWKSFGGYLKNYIGHNAYLEFIDDGDATIAIDEIWFANGPPPPVTSRLLETIAAGPSGIDSAWQTTLENYSGQARDVFLDWLIDNELMSVSDVSPAAAGESERGSKIAATIPRPRYVLAMAQGSSENVHVYVRGNPTMLGAEVPPRAPESLGGDTLSRLELADRIASGDNPLAARVIVNRLWHHVFGRGIVPSVDDFGPQGQSPTHPELLDALASDFMANGWSIKKAIRQMVLSQTYGQSSVADATQAEKIAVVDPTNALLHRMRVRRLPGESIRDAILSISGRLDPKLFGGSVPTHRTAFMTGRGARGSGPLDGNGRRSVYLSIYRNFLNPFLLAFDMPSPFGPQGRRSNSNVPAQALTLMNDPFVLEQSRIWAERVLASEDSNSEERIKQMVRRAHGVSPSPTQLQRLVNFVAADQDNGQSDKQAWADLAHALLNMKSFYFLK